MVTIPEALAVEQLDGIFDKLNAYEHMTILRAHLSLIHRFFRLLV